MHDQVFAPWPHAGRRDGSSGLLVCFSHLRWDFVWQRPQHLLSRAARSYRVLFIEEPFFRGQERPHLEITDRPGGITVVQPILPERLAAGGLEDEEVVEAQRVLIERMLEAEDGLPRLFWFYTPMAQGFARDLPCDACVYDNMDELSAFKFASPRLLALESELLERADVVFTGGLSLFEAKRHRHSNIHAFPSSIERAHFARARKTVADGPADQAGLARPRLGFFGVVDERMDIDLVREVADLRPDWQFVMIGPVVKIDPADLPRRDNIHWLGGRSYADLPDYLGRWDVGFMPFALNEATRFISPTKTPEFLAAGVPVVSTPITDVVRPYGDKGLVEIAATATEVVEKADLLMSRGDAERRRWLNRVDRHLAAGSWDQTFAAMEERIRATLRGSGSVDRAGASMPITAVAAPPAE